MKSQSGFVMIFLLIMVIGFIILFLVTFIQTVKNTEYTQLYTTNLLLSVLRSDTGFTDPNCRLVSDAIYCGFTKTQYLCGSSGKTCYEIAHETVEGYMDYDTDIAKKGFSHLFVAEPQYPWSPEHSSGNPIEFKIGETSIENSRTKKIVANEIIGSGNHFLNIRLFVVES